MQAALYNKEKAMKKISIVIPTYNEVQNVEAMAKTLVNIMTTKLNDYDYEILFIDNYSTDGTREKLRALCKQDKNIKAIFNAKNFGQFNSPFYGLLQVTGDCVIPVAADFQDPPETIVDFVREWEKGYRIVIGIKSKSKEGLFMRCLRSMYYKLLKQIGDVEHIEQYMGFGLYDRQFIEVLRGLDESMPYLRGLVAELGYERKEVPYEKPNRNAGKSKNNFYTLFDAGMLGITSCSKLVLRLATIGGFFVGGLSVLIGCIYFILKLIYWDRFQAGMAPILIGMFFLGAVQLFFIGFLGEYIMNINIRVMHRPLVVEEQRINFEEEE